MSEQEKQLQIGQLAEEYSRLNGELNHVNEKLTRASEAYRLVGSAMSQNQITLTGPDFTLQAHPAAKVGQLSFKPDTFSALLNHHELQEAFRAQKQLRVEVDDLRTRLKALAPHLV